MLWVLPIAIVLLPINQQLVSSVRSECVQSVTVLCTAVLCTVDCDCTDAAAELSSDMPNTHPNNFISNTNNSIQWKLIKDGFSQVMDDYCLVNVWKWGSYWEVMMVWDFKLWVHWWIFPFIAATTLSTSNLLDSELSEQFSSTHHQSSGCLFQSAS